MEIARSVGPDWTNWTRDGAAIDSARNQLGQAINQIMNERAPSAASGASSANVATIDSVAGSSTASRGR
jgi:hypothetical protein